MRRTPDQLLPLELEILEAALGLERRRVTHFHGYSLAKLLQERGDRRLLTAHGTLYRALHRLESTGLIEATWEDHNVAESENRPRRRIARRRGLYEKAQSRERRSGLGTDGAPRHQTA